MTAPTHTGETSSIPASGAPVGLPMVARQDSEQLAAEVRHLEQIDAMPLPRRWWHYFRLSGPGWLQGAMTLGAGTSSASLFAGAMLGYELLWLQPIAMLTGVIMLNALAYQTLSTGLRPFEAVRRYVHPAAAWGWALASLLASIVWHFPQYNVSAAVVADMANQVNVDLSSNLARTGVCFVILLISILITWNYNRGSLFVKLYENVMKTFVAIIVLSFAAVALKTGIQWDRLLRGFFAFHIPWDDPKGMSVLIGGFAAAVGINMTFLLPYSMLARGWGRAHRGLARFDLSIGLFIPFVLATSFIIIAAANTLYPSSSPPSTVKFASAVEGVVGKHLSHWVFGLGVLGMTMSTIPLHMLVCGFIAVEIFNIKPTGWSYRLATLIPAPGFLAPLLWGKLEFWLAVPTSIFCFLLLPIAYVSFWILMNRRDYLGDDQPAGIRRVAWNVVLGLIVVIVTVGGVYKVIESAPGWYRILANRW